MNKNAIIESLSVFIRQRPGLEFGNYGSARAYRSEMREITRDRHNAERLLSAVERSQVISGADIVDASRRAFSGRLEITCDGDTVRVSYTAGQYFPTEYRRAVCSVCAEALWNAWRADYPTGDSLRAAFRRHFGRGISARWFN